MTSEKLLGEDLVDLQKEKGKICASVIVPTHRLSPERRGDITETKKAIAKAADLLEYTYRDENIKPVISNLHELYESIDFTHNEEGIGLFASPDARFLVKFPFPVEMKIMAGFNFEIRDILYKINYGVPYYLLLLTENKTKLLAGSWNQVTEVRDKFFPAPFEDLYIYSLPSRSTSQAGQTHTKSFERDKSVMEEIRLKDFFRGVNKKLKGYLANDTPLVLAGPEKEMAWFESVSDHNQQIIHRIGGSYSHQNLKEITATAWNAMHEHLQKERIKLLKEFEEKLGEQKGISGIQDVWEAAEEGKAFKLLVEKDYRIPGFTKENDPHLYLLPPPGPHHVIPDAVDELIETVLDKKGKVYFTDNGVLKDHRQIALITRY